MPRLNPAILKWARETAGLSADSAVKKLGLRDARGVSALDRLSALESGDELPSRPLIVRMAKQYRRPLLTFYLDQIPRLGERGRDLRSIQERSTDEEAVLDALIRTLHARQSLLRAAMEDDEDAAPLPFVGSMTRDAGVAAVLASIKDTLGFRLRDYRQEPNLEAAFRRLRGHVEAAGVFVLLQGNLGTYHTSLSVETFRGFALADPIAPFVVINDEDSRAAWPFTLVHELVHIWLGQTAISGGAPEQGIEKFCNDVASEFLLPNEEVKQFHVGHSATIEDLERQVSEFARPRHVSRTMVAYRLYAARFISEPVWERLRRRFRDQWIEQRDRRRRKARESEKGPNYYIVRRHRLGAGLLGVTERLLDSHALPTSKVAQVLGVKPHQVHVLLGNARTALAS
jgi:Zn-dependent peptidase ImmA (M78 family)